MSINHLNIQNKQTGDKLSATEFNSTTSKINEVVDGVNASATGGKIGSNGTPLTKDSSGRIIIPLATSSSSGAMSASDKSKLDSINPSGGTGDYVDSISNEANYTANDMYDTTSEFYGTNHKINTRSISYTTSDGSTHTFTHLDTVYKPATASTTINGQTISGKAGLLSPQDKQKLDMMPRPSDITSALSGKADKQIVVLVTRTQQGSTYVYSASKTFTEISTAIGNGTNVILQYDGNYYHLSYSTRDYIVFTRFVDDYYMYSSIEVNSHDEWSYSSFILQEELTIDSTPTSGSGNPISSGGVYNALRSNFKTINGNSIVGSGSVTIDTSMIPYVSQDSHADFQGCVLDEVLNYLDDYKQATLTFDSTPTSGSTNPVTSGGVFSALRYDGNSTNYVASDDSFEDCIESLDSELANKQDTLVSGTNIKTVNGTTLLGSGNIDADDVIMGKIDGTSFYKVTGYSGLNATPTFSDTAETGNENKIYVDILSNRAYRWTKSIVSLGESKYKLLSEELSIVTDNEINSLPPSSTKKAVSAKVLRDNFYTESEVDTLLGAKQDTLVSGTNIKTINGESLVGSGNITLDTETVNYDGDGNTYFAAGDSLTEGLDSMADAIDNISPNEISSITATESITSGGNNVVTITETNGTTTTFNVKNGIDGADGVSLGEVALVQTTGDDEESVMSQKAVTDYGRKLLEEEDVNGNGTMMRQILTSLGWEFDKYIREGGGYTAATDNVVTPFIEIGECGNHIIEAAYFLTGSSLRGVVFFNSNKTRTTSFSQYETNRYFRTLGDVSTKYVRYTVHVDRIRDCYIYDHTAKQFMFKGDEYLDDIINNYNVGYGYMGDKNVLKHTFIKPTCFLGTLCYYKLSKFPNLDPRTCDGLSVALDGYMGGSWGSIPFLLMHTGSNNFNTANYFAIAANYSTIRCGVLTSYYQTVVNGCSLTGTNTRFAHLVITFDFKTGNVTSYNNGVLSATNTPETYSESDLRTFINSCTELYLGWSLKTACMAVFPYVLTADDVKSIYGIGVSSTKGELIPDIWNANLLHPQAYSGQNIGIYLGNANVVRSNDGDAAVLTSNSTTAQFGFTGIQGTIHNHIYEWDMEVVSGTWTQYSRGMIYNNNYYKYVTIYDSNNNDVSYDELSTGNYHVICKPNNVLRNQINATQNNLNYIFNTTEGAVMRITNLKVVERGAALICGINNFKGDYFEQINGNKVPVSKFVPYGGSVLTDYYTTYKEDVIEYSSSATVQYTGQMAVDITNNKVYVGYLTGSGTGTWKQINNS